MRVLYLRGGRVALLKISQKGLEHLSGRVRPPADRLYEHMTFVNPKVDCDIALNWTRDLMLSSPRDLYPQLGFFAAIRTLAPYNVLQSFRYCTSKLPACRRRMKRSAEDDADRHVKYLVQRHTLITLPVGSSTKNLYFDCWKGPDPDNCGIARSEIMRKYYPHIPEPRNMTLPNTRLWYRSCYFWKEQSSDSQPDRGKPAASLTIIESIDR